MSETVSTEKSSTDSNPNFIGRVSSDVPQTALEKSPDIAIDTTISVPKEGDITLYSEKFGRPFIVTHMNIADIYESGDLKEQTDSIDQYINDQITKSELQKTKSSYLSILNELRSKMNIDPNLDYAKQIERLATYISILNKEKELELKKRALEYHASTHQRR